MSGDRLAQIEALAEDHATALLDYRDVLALVEIVKHAEEWAYRRRKFIDSEGSLESLRDAEASLVHAVLSLARLDSGATE